MVAAALPIAPSGMPVHIELHDFVLRSLTPEDVTARFVEWINDEQMLKGLNLHKLNFSYKQLKDFVASFNNVTSYFVGIFDRRNGLLVGFYSIDVNPMHRTGSITTGIGERNYHGRDVFWQTIDALLDHFYLYRNVEKITARILARNIQMLYSFRGNERFKLEAKLVRECLGTDGKRLDVLVFASHKE